MSGNHHTRATANAPHESLLQPLVLLFQLHKGDRGTFLARSYRLIVFGYGQKANELSRLSRWLTRSQPTVLLLQHLYLDLHPFDLFFKLSDVALERFRLFLGHLLVQGDHLELIVELGFSSFSSKASLFGVFCLSTLSGQVLLDFEEAGCE